MSGRHELRVVFSEEFRPQIHSRGFAFFTVAILAMMLIAIPLTPVVVDVAGALPGAGQQQGGAEAVQR